MFLQLDEKREPLLMRVRQCLIDYREGLFAIAFAALYPVLIITISVLLQSKFNGVWFRTSADSVLPSEMQLHISSREDRLVIEVGVPLTCTTEAGNETVTLLLDGRTHEVTGEGPGCAGLLKEAAEYSAKHTRDTVQIELAGMPDGKSVTEMWSLSGRGNLLTVSLPDRKIFYRKATWFRSMFYSNGL